jgi:hypothetical protein
MVRILVTAFASVFLCAVSLLTPASETHAAAPRSLSFLQSCTPRNTVNLRITWTSDPSARELWIDAGTVDGAFAPDTFVSAGPLSGRTSSYQWPDLEPHKVYWFRVNQLLPSGDWEASAPQRYILGCGNVVAPAGKIQITGLGDGSGATPTAPNGRIKSCNPSVLIGYIRISALTEITDVTYLFYQGSTLIGRITSALDSESTTWNVGAGRPPGGFSEGPYSFEVWTGGDGTWRSSARASITLDC